MIIIVHVEGPPQIKFWGNGYYPVRRWIIAEGRAITRTFASNQLECRSSHFADSGNG